MSAGHATTRREVSVHASNDGAVFEVALFSIGQHAFMYGLKHDGGGVTLAERPGIGIRATGDSGGHKGARWDVIVNGALVG
ncbi:hypothetical protein VCRA2113O207_1010002 [Vibrio crassostreae]|nr:hypothetical protein VCRA2113O207_1010002 [Vibrio crassostreae]